VRVAFDRHQHELGVASGVQLLKQDVSMELEDLFDDRVVLERPAAGSPSQEIAQRHSLGVCQAAENLGEDPTLGIEDVIHARSSGASEGSIDGMFGEEEQLVRDSGFHGRMDLFISPRFPKC